MYRRRLRLGELVKRIFVVVVAAVLLLVIGTRVYSGHRVRSALDSLADHLSPLGHFAYLDVTVGFNGRVRIEGLSFHPDADLDMAPVMADEAVITTPGMLYLTGLHGSMPRYAAISLTGLWIDMADMAGLDNEPGPSRTGNPFEALACGNLRVLREHDLEQMGNRVDQAIDLRLRYRLDGDRVMLVMEQADTQISSFRLNATLVAPNPSIDTQNLSDLKFAEGSLILSAADFNRRRNEFCGERTGVTPEEYVDANVQATRNHLRQKGIVPRPTLIEHYRGFLSGLGDWRFDSRPQPPVALEDLSALKLERLLEWLDIRSTIPGLPPIVFKFSYYGPVPEDGEAAGGRQSALANRRIALPRGLDPWVPVKTSQVRRLLRERVSLRTTSQKNYVGYLVSVDSSRLVIDARVRGGTATIPIRFDQVSQVRVRQSVFERVFDESGR